MGEPTNKVVLPNTAKLIEEIMELVALEAEALLSTGGDDADEQLADANMRLALFAIDVYEDSDAGARYLELADRHPLAPRMRISYAISAMDAAALEAATGVVETTITEERARAAVLREIAEAWLYRFGDFTRAAEVARNALEIRSDSVTAIELQHLYMVALGAAGEWSELGAALADAAADKRADAETIAEALHVLYDRLDDPAGTAELIAQVADRLIKLAAKKPAIAMHVYRGLRIAVEVARIDGVSGVELGDVLRRCIDVLATDGDAVLESAAAKFLLADVLRSSDKEVAGALLAEVAALEGASALWGPRLASLAVARTASQHGDWSVFTDCLLELATARGGGKLASAHAWRAAEVVDARVAAPPKALELWRAVATAGRADQASRSVERLLLAGQPADLVAFLEEAAASGDKGPRSAALRRASAVAESRLDDLAVAIRLAIAASEVGQLVADHEHLARLYRRERDRSRLADQYRTLSGLDKNRRSTAALLCAAGALELSGGHAPEAEEAFSTAARQAAKDPTARFALASLLRRSSRWKELAVVLNELAAMVMADATRLSTLNELGRLYAEKLNDPRRARETLSKALELDPDNAETLHALALLYDHSRDWNKAVELRQRAADSVEDYIQQAGLMLEIGRIEEIRRKDMPAALSAYEKAFELDATSVEALRAQQAIHRKNERADDLTRVLREELQLGVDSKRRLEIQLEIANASGADDGEGALLAYLDALEVDPENAIALAGVEKIGRATSNWEVLRTAFRSAPKTAKNLQVLAEALSKLGAWSEFAEVRLSEIELATSNAEKVKLATHLGGIYEQQLSDVDNAIAMHQRALTFGPPAPDSQREVARLLEENGRWPELAAAYELELTTVPASNVERQVGLLLRLGELRRDKLSKPGDAALAYEAVLERQATHIPALESLEQLYDRLGREKDLLRVLEARAEATEDPMERAGLFTRIADVKDKRGDFEGAIRCYRDAFKADPANRDVFTAMEKLCYKHERWSEAMELYSTAIDLVENKASRAYRLGDLYARRGQIQLQYLSELGEAAASYLKVIELDPENDTSVKFLESIFSQQQDWVGLIAAYQKRAELTRDDDRRLETLRRAARVAGAKLKDPSEAARIYELILKVDTGDRESLDALERFHERAQDWNKLVEVLKLRLASAPAGDAATALLKRIAQICEEGLRDEQRAIEHYLRILEIAPGNKEALEALGRIYESTEQWAEFIDVTRRQIRVTTDRNVKALLYFKCGSVMEAKFSKEEDAIRYYDAAIKTSPSCLPAVHGLRDLYRRRKDWPRVIQTLELEVKLWQDDKERAGVFAQIGRIYSAQLGQPERAMHYYESALAVDPECLPANKALFEHYFDVGEWSRAQTLAQALAQKAMREGDPTARSEFYRKRGIVAHNTGDSRGSAESLIIALEIKPTNLMALEALGDLAGANPDAYDFTSTYRELDKIYKKRDDSHRYLARVRVAQAVMEKRNGDLDAAEELYDEANTLAEGDFAILSALVDLHCGMRRWTHAVDRIVKFLEAEPGPDEPTRLRALMRQAEIHADCEMDPHKAISVLREVIRLKSDHQDAYYRIAQEHYALGRYAEAKSSIDRVIQLAAAPGSPVSPEQLARYYYYLGRIMEASGESRGAASQYRRAAEYDPGYAPPALSLARRASDAGDQRQAETLLINAAHAAMEAGGATAAVPLQRGLARILLASGDRPAAIEAYRGILNVEPDGATDRVALAEIYAIDDLPKAINELKKVLDRDIRHGPAYRLLASFYARTGEHDRAARVLSVMEMLGYADESDRGAASTARAAQTHAPLRRVLDGELRSQLLLTEAVREPVGEIYTAIAAEVTALFPPPTMGENLVPVQTIDDPALKVALADLTRLYNVDAEVYIGEHVPGMVVVTAYPRRIIVIDRELLTESDACRRFLIGWALEAVRGGYALLFSLGRRQRSELGSLLRSLLLNESERAGPTNEFVRSLPKRAIKVIERHAGKGRDVDTDVWIDGMLALAKRGGLFGSDDFGAAIRMIARLNGENLAFDDTATQALGAVLGGADLVRFYLTDEYHRLREILSNPMPAGDGPVQ